MDDFPTCLIDKYVHWLDLSTGELEFRPVGSPWTPETSNWRLYIHKPGINQPAVLQRCGQGIASIKLIDIRSRTFNLLSSLLSPIESPKYIMATYTTAQTVEVSLPRFRLSFFVNTDGELECRSMPGYVIDRTRTCGTMFGLSNKLILRPGPTKSEDFLPPQRVIIPHGEVSFGTNGDFISVSIDTNFQQHVSWHEYTIDVDLGCLTNNTSLSGKLYQCYLHALTSHCLPDPLLGHTGTEEALYILESASCRSFQRLGVQEATLLKLISNLTPERDYYPRHLRSMATVKWNDLPALSQHHDFFRTTCTLFDYARSLEVLYVQRVAFGNFSRNQSLLTRAASRNKSYYSFDLRRLDQALYPADVIYQSRDISDLEAAEHVAFQTSWSIWNYRPSLDCWLPIRNLWDLMNSWGSLCPSDGKVSLRYSRYWLECIASRDWFLIYNRCREAINEDCQHIKIELCFSLSAVAYSKSNYKDIIPFLIVFMLDKRCRNLGPPSDRYFRLADGLAPEYTRLEDIVCKSARHMKNTPVHSLQIGRKQKRAEYNATIRKESSIVATSVSNQWPHYQSVDFPDQWFDNSAFMKALGEYDQSISRNIQLREHVLQLQDITQQYCNDWDVIPVPMPYVLSPKFITNGSSARSYSFHDVLVSRANVPTPSTDGEPIRGCVISSTAGAEAITQVASSDNLESLIKEFRNSPQPLLQLYGHGLKKSHQELLGHHSPLLVRGAVPPHELLLVYHNECSHRKDKIFSEILESLAPFQNEEEIINIAGLWPRITPRSLLRQLAQDRINELPDKWRSVIMRYATALLRYRHSIRLLKLSSKQNHEELFQETEAIRNDQLEELTPDWLLVQVRPIFTG
jgi:hypothetical protein